jgi:hypothetical protein
MSFAILGHEYFPRILSMHYCQTHFHAVPPEQVEDLLSSFSKDNFVAAQAAHKLADGGFNIDAGKNDVLAYYDENEETIKFICRYERDVGFFDRKIQSFAAKYGIDTTNVS